MENRLISICFRHDDGEVTAARINRLLKDQPIVPSTGGDRNFDPPRLSVHFDPLVQGNTDWQALREPVLRRSQALIVVCSPGIKHPVDSDGWADRDIAWWQEHRTEAPILVDPIGTDTRWVPQSIADKWPDAEPITMIEGDLAGLAAADQTALEHRAREQLLAAIFPSGDSDGQEPEQTPDKVRELQRSLDEQRLLSKQLQTSLSDQQQTSQKLRISLNKQKQSASTLQTILGEQQARSRQWRWAFGIVALLLATKMVTAILVPL